MNPLLLLTENLLSTSYEQIKIQRAEIPHDVLITSVGVNSGVGKSTRMLQMAGSVAGLSVITVSIILDDDYNARRYCHKNQSHCLGAFHSMIRMTTKNNNEQEERLGAWIYKSSRTDGVGRRIVGYTLLCGFKSH